MLQKPEVGRLAGGHDDLIGFKRELGSGDGQGPATALESNSPRAMR
jgi:hypothetical protein